MQVHHLDKLLSAYPLGILIKFEASLKLWQKSLPENSSENRSVNDSCGPSTSSIIYSKPPMSNTSFCLETVLKENSQCAHVVDYYSLHNCLNDSCRAILVTAIINYIIKENIPMSIKLADVIADTIVTRFPTELKVST